MSLMFLSRLPAQLLLAGFFLPLWSGGIVGGEPLEQILQQPLLKPKENDDRLTKFILDRIPKLKLPATAADWQNEVERLRREFLEKSILKGVPKSWTEGQPQIEWGEVIEIGKGYRIKKLRYEALPGLWIPALMYEPINLTGKVPVVLNQNGHDTTGMAAEREQLRGIHLAKRGMIALNFEWLYLGELNNYGLWHDQLPLLDLVGVNGASVFYLPMARGLDVLLAHEHADPQRVAVTGWSGGAQQTILFSALDSRVTAAIPVAGHSAMAPRIRDRYSVGHLEVNPTDMVTVGEYLHLTAMMCPRPLLLIYNEKDDCCHTAEFAKPITFDPVRPFYEQAGAGDAFDYYIDTQSHHHNYGKLNREALYRFLDKHFFTDRGESIPTVEQPAGDEVKSKDALKVGVPADNATFNSLAARIAADLPKPLPHTTVEDRLSKLAEILRIKRQPMKAEIVDSLTTANELTVERYRLYDGDDWVLPAVVVSPKSPKETRLLAADGGYAKQAIRINQAAQAGSRVICVDLLFCGGASVEDGKPGTLHLNVQFLPNVGARPLGVQSAQLTAALKLFSEKYGFKTVTLSTVGPRSGLAGLCAAAFDGGELIRQRETSDLPADELPSWAVIKDVPESLKELLKYGYYDAPELYCFGLLEWFDVPQLKALAERKLK